MKFKSLIALAAALCCWTGALADGPYRAHRYDSFMATPPAAEKGTQIVFLGNSITNMHNWTEAFGTDARVVNRGNSGGFAYEWIEEVASVTDSRPAKVFIGIGTNDLSLGRTPEATVADIRTIVKRIKVASPETEVYVQSILPRSADNVWSKIITANALLAEMCPTIGAKFIDLTDTMMGVRTTTGSSRTTWAPDGLHPAGIGYRAWCDFIKDEVNGTCAYSAGEYHPELTSLSNPSRISQFSLLPVSADDILFLGDEMVENGEWNELLGVPAVKKRSNGYGHGGIGLTHARDIMKVSLLTDPASQKAPAQVMIYCGVSELASSTPAATYKANYQSLVDYIKSIAPTTRIVAVSMLGVNNDALAQQYNAALQEIAAADASVTYVDIYTDMKANAANSMSGNYVNGRGYVRIANLLAPVVKGAKPVSLDEFEKYYATRQSHKQLGAQFNKLIAVMADDASFGDAYGQYKPSARAAFESLADEIAAVLAGTAAVSEQQLADFSEKVGALMGDASNFNYPQGFDGRFYRLTSARGNRSLTVCGEVVNGLVAPAAVSMGGNDIWKFVKRDDGTFDIVSFSGRYLVPASGSTSVSVSVSTTRPANAGWQIGASENSPRTFVIYGTDGSTRWQLNQSSDANVWNWFGNLFPNTEDEGCAYRITEFTGNYFDPACYTSGWYEIEGATGLEALGQANKIINVDKEWRQNLNGTILYYPLKYAAPDAAKPAKSFVHVTVTPNGWQLTALNGHGVKDNCTADRSSLSGSVVPVTVEGENLVNIAYWTSFTAAGDSYGEFPIVGKMSSSDCRHKAVRVSDDVIAAYDIWSVKIIGTPSSEVGTDLCVTLDIDANKGSATVFDGGSFFLTKGTEVKATDLTFGGNVSAQTKAEPDVTIDPASHTITVDFGAPATNGLATGWYEIELVNDLGGYVSAGKHHMLNAEDEFRQNNTNYYALKFAAPDAAKPAKSFIHITVNGSTHQFTGLGGHGIKENCTSDRNSLSTNNPAVTASGTAWAIGKWSNFTNDGPESPYVGKSSNSNNTYRITPVDADVLDSYDLYTVTLHGHANASEVGQDPRVTLSHDANKGITKVFNGGTFFVTKGTALTPADFTADASNGNSTPDIVVDPVAKTVNVYYAGLPAQPVAVTGIKVDRAEATLTPGATLLLEATVEPADADAPVVLWSSSDPAVATVTLGGLVTAVAPGTVEITATCSGFKAVCTVTVEVPAESVSLDRESADLEIGRTITLVATVTPADTTDELLWTSSDEKIATVSAEGLVTAVADGTAVITATCGKHSATCTVKVTDPRVSISEISADKAAEAPAYDLQGRRAAANSRGVIIVNGRKTVR